MVVQSELDLWGYGRPTTGNRGTVGGIFPLKIPDGSSDRRIKF